MNEIAKLGRLDGIAEISGARIKPPPTSAGGFVDALEEAVRSVDDLQKQGESAQSALAAGRPVELHEVLIKVEEAEIAFRTMMSVRNKLVDAYREIMRMGSGG